jgi:hypothetical protein
VALISLSCPSCGAKWQTITGSHVSFDGTKCECGTVGEKQVSAGSHLKGYDYDRILNPQTKDDALEKQAVLEHRAWMEKNEHLRDSGEVNVNESGPAWTRPFGNRERERKFY